MSQTQFNDLFDLDFTHPKGFNLASRILDIRNQANRIAEQANKKQIANGEFATMFAENIKDWLNDIGDVAESALHIHLETNTKTKD
jgi:hypothetical protein